MFLQPHTEFSTIVDKIYSIKLDNIDEEITYLLSQQLYKKSHSEIIFAQALNNIFFASIAEATDKIYLKSKYKKELNIKFNFSTYVDYLINHLENKSENGPFLAANFIKKINSVHNFPKNISLNYQISFEPSGLVIGYLQYEENNSMQEIQKAYREVISIPMKNSIKENISLLINEIEAKELNQLCHQLTEKLLFTQGQNEKNVVQYHFNEFKDILHYATNVVINNIEYTKDDAIANVNAIHPSLLHYNENIFSSHKIK